MMAAVALGASLDVPIVVLCSGRSLPYQVIEQASRVAGSRCIAIDMFNPRFYADLSKFRTEEFADAIGGAR